MDTRAQRLRCCSILSLGIRRACMSHLCTMLSHVSSGLAMSLYGSQHSMLHNSLNSSLSQAECDIIRPLQAPHCGRSVQSTSWSTWRSCARTGTWRA